MGEYISPASKEFQNWITEKERAYYRSSQQRAQDAQKCFEDQHYQPINYLCERIPFTLAHKEFFSASPDKLPLAEEFMRQKHLRQYPEGVFLVVDVAKLLEDGDISPEGDFYEVPDRIYASALEQLDPNSQETGHPRMEFGDATQDYNQSHGGKKHQVALMIENIDAITRYMNREESDNFILATFRISAGHHARLIGHIASREDFDWSGKASERLNDVQPIWEPPDDTKKWPEAYDQ